VLQSLNVDPLQPTPVIGFATRDAQPASQRVQAFMTLLQDHAAAFADTGLTAIRPNKAKLPAPLTCARLNSREQIRPPAKTYGGLRDSIC
jgi:hypothetical protein